LATVNGFLRFLLPLIYLSFTIFEMAGCGKHPEEVYRPSFGETIPTHRTVFRFGVHPLHNPTRLSEVFGPLTDYLSAHLPGNTFILEASRNYAAYDEKLYSGRFDFSLPNPYQTVNSLKFGYRVFGKMGDDDNFRGIILVRKDGFIHEVTDLKGRAVSFPAPTALAATMLPQYFLYTHGLDIAHDIDVHYVGSQESSIMNVYLGNTAAGATWPPPWRALLKERPELGKALEIKWRTESLPNNGLVVRTDVPPAIVEQVSQLLFNLHTHKEGRRMLARMELSRFEPATDQTYQPVVEFIERFNKTVRPLQ
jgi:phosphonate transport system substrate-binding protein